MDSNNVEKIVSYILAPLGVIAILVNLFFIKGFSVSDGLDALKDLAGLTVAFVVVLMALKAFKGPKKLRSFYKKVHEKIEHWATDNVYLIEKSEIKGYDGDAYFMICDLSSFADVSAAESNKQKGVFLYFPAQKDFEKDKHIVFRINKSLFLSRYKDDFETVMPFILNKISDKISIVFKDLNLMPEVNKSEMKVKVRFQEIAETDENAQRIIDIIEFTKTLILAMA